MDVFKKTQIFRAKAAKIAKKIGASSSRPSRDIFFKMYHYRRGYSLDTSGGTNYHEARSAVPVTT